MLLRRPPTDAESLLQTFGESAEARDEEEIELDLKKNFFYVVNPEGKIIDCAKIYSFLHEENIYKRIVAKVSRDVDERIKN